MLRLCRPLVALGLGVALCCVAAAPQAQVQPAALAPGEAALEGRLFAPCCWTQTLYQHASPLASELREEIHDRLVSGESPDAIEADLAARHGERIRTVPRGRDPRSMATAILGLLVLATAFGLFWLLRRWSRRSTPAFVEPPRRPVRSPDEYDARLDADLRALEDG